MVISNRRPDVGCFPVMAHACTEKQQVQHLAGCLTVCWRFGASDPAGGPAWSRVFGASLRKQGGRPGCARSESTIETWLILPVVIRLSQRLSHACLSISTYTVKLRMAHYISYSLFDSPYYLDNRSNSRANTCAKSRLRERKGCIY